jgi:hypothetical protein
MADHEPLIPSFRDFSYFQPEVFGPQLPELRKPTVLEVERVLSESPAGKLGLAVDTEGWPWLKRMDFLDAVIPGLKVHSIGGMEPFQADGIWGPYEWYYRERGGGASLRLNPLGSFPGISEALYGAHERSEMFAGTQGWVTRFLQLWERLAVESYLYEFDAKTISIDRVGDEENPRFELRDTGEVEITYGRGFSIEEARNAAGTYSSYLDERLGWSRELQDARRELQEISLSPRNSDERVFPSQTPDFTVLWNELQIPEGFERFVA